MYKYDAVDQRLVDERVNQYEGQLNRYLKKELSDEEFRPLRLQKAYTFNVMLPCYELQFHMVFFPQISFVNYL